MLTKRGSQRHLAAFVISLALLLALPAVAQADWGAIAVNITTGKTGISYGYNTAAAAKNRARNECGRDKCRVAVWVRNGYAALVRKRSGVFVAGAGPTRARAFQKARHRAHEQAARNVISVYSG
ncbi:MAG TPA: DUF4189 domain-containing protein [Solirubrobacterales bacterium]|nr:DUF4189 domain-containing protein [Solirubrobacterales bacterium]